MSLPTFPEAGPNLEDSLNMILASVAMEEMGLSHIINAEGEKLQYVIGTLEEGPGEAASVTDVLEVNKSVKSLLDSITQTQIILKGKMESAIQAIESEKTDATGPTGPPGPQGKPGPSRRAVSLRGCPGQCWVAGAPLRWSRSDCPGLRALQLSSDCRKILLERCKCYTVSFSIDLCAAEQDSQGLSIGVQIRHCDKKTNQFVFHGPALLGSSPVTASAAGIFIPAHNSAAELMLTLLSPASVRANHSSVCVMEL